MLPLVAAALGLGAVSGLFGLGSSLIGAGGSYAATQDTNKTNLKIANQNLAYQREFNQQIFRREDTAQQRAVADARAAGFSPLAAVGMQAGAGGTAAAPQNTAVMQAPDMSALGNSLSGFQQAFQSASNMAFQAHEAEANRANQLSQTMINAAASMYSADSSAATGRYSADSSAGTAAARLAEDKRQFDQSRSDNKSRRDYQDLLTKWASDHPAETFGAREPIQALVGLFRDLIGPAGTAKGLQSLFTAPSNSNVPDSIRASYDSGSSADKANFDTDYKVFKSQMSQFSSTRGRKRNAAIDSAVTTLSTFVDQYSASLNNSDKLKLAEESLAGYPSDFRSSVLEKYKSDLLNSRPSRLH